MALKKDEILGEWKFEEEFILRVRDSNLANRIRRILREEDEPGQRISIEFEGCFFFSFVQGHTLPILNLSHFQVQLEKTSFFLIAMSFSVGSLQRVGSTAPCISKGLSTS